MISITSGSTLYYLDPTHHNPKYHLYLVLTDPEEESQKFVAVMVMAAT